MLRYIIPIILFSLLFFISKAQQTPTVTPKGYKGKSVFDIKNYKGDPRDRLIFEVNHTGWLGTSDKIKMDWKCIGFNLAFMFDKPIGASNFSFGFGLGVCWHNYSSNADIIYKLDSTNNTTRTLIQPKTIPYLDNRYSETSIEVPLEIRIRTKSATMFKVHFGAKFGYVFTDYKRTDDADGEIQRYNIKNVNTFRFGLSFRIGLESICLTGCYYLSEVFTSNGPKGIAPYSIGIAIIPY